MSVVVLGDAAGAAAQNGLSSPAQPALGHARARRPQHGAITARHRPSARISFLSITRPEEEINKCCRTTDVIHN